MTVDELLARFENVRSAGDNQWDARCPAHDDRHQSLAIGQADDRYLLHCHAGCDTNSVVIAAGLAWADLFESNRDQPATIVGGGRIRLGNVRRALAVSTFHRKGATRAAPPLRLVDAWAADLGVVADRLLEVKGWSRPTLERLRVGWDGRRVTIPVFGADGDLVTMVRYLPGGKPKTMAFPPRELFPAPESIEGGSVWLVEGEPDAISGHELGIRAVAVPGVATWREEWPERFLGRRVTLCMDADAEGRQCAKDRAVQLAQYGVQAAIVDLAPDRDDGTDLGDLLVGAIAVGRVGDLRAYLARLEREAWAAT